MRISDWSSDVCSSDLLDDAPFTAKILQLNTTLTREGAAMAFALGSEAAQGIDSRGQLSASGDIEMYFANFDDYDRYKAETAHHVSYREIGRASCRERVCQTCRSRWSTLH